MTKDVEATPGKTQNSMWLGSGIPSSCHEVLSWRQKYSLNIVQCSIETGPSAHYVYANHDAILNSSHLPAHGPYDTPDNRLKHGSLNRIVNNYYLSVKY